MESGRQSPPDDAAAEASGGRRHSDVDQSPAVLPLSAKTSGKCHGDVDLSSDVLPDSVSDEVARTSEESTPQGNNSENSKELRGELASATAAPCGDNLENVAMVAESFDRMTIQNPV